MTHEAQYVFRYQSFHIDKSQLLGHGSYGAVLCSEARLYNLIYLDSVTVTVYIGIKYKNSHFHERRHKIDHQCIIISLNLHALVDRGWRSECIIIMIIWHTNTIKLMIKIKAKLISTVTRYLGNINFIKCSISGQEGIFL